MNVPLNNLSAPVQGTGKPDAKLQEHIDPVPEAWELQQQPTPSLNGLRLKVRALLQPDNIPDSLKQMPIWLLWKATALHKTIPGKFNKIPVYATNGQNRSGAQGTPADRRNLVTFDKAYAAFGRHPDTIWGLGIAFLLDGGVTAYDGDKCVIDGVVNFDTESIIDGTYAEISPSGTGVRAIWAGACHSAKNNPLGHELFGDSGFVTITGNRINGTDVIATLSEAKKAELEMICSKTGTAPAPRQQDDFANYAAPLDGWDIARVKFELLANIPADCSYDEWRDVVAGCIHQLGKTEEVREMLLNWSKTAPTQFSSRDFNTLYNSLKPTPTGKKPVTLRSVIDMAKCRGNVSEAPPQKIDPQRLKKALAVHVDGHVAFPDPFPGHMTAIVEEALRLAPAPQPELTMMGAVIGMCASVGSHYCLPNGQRTAMQGIISAKSTAGKEWAVVVAEAIARAAGATIAGRPASGPALEDSISETPVLICNNEFAKTLFQAKGNSSSPLAGVVEILLKIFTGAGGSYSIRGRSKIKGAEEQAQRTYHHPNLCTIGLGTPEGFAQCLDTTAISDGYLGRVLFVASNTLPPVRRQKGKFLLPSGVTTFLDHSQLIDPMRAPAVQVAPNDPGNIIVATYADESEMDALIGRCNAAASRAEGDTAILIRRNYEKAERICLMLAVWDNPKAPVVTKAHILWAEQLINASNAALLHFVGNQMFDELAQRDGALILGSMKMILRGERKPYKPQHLVEGDQARVSRSFLIAVTKLDATRFNKGMDNLIMRGEVSISGIEGGITFSGQAKRYQWVTLEC